MKTIITIVILLSLILLGCVEKSIDLDSLSDEELDLAMEQGSLVGKAVQGQKQPLTCEVNGNQIILRQGLSVRNLGKTICSGTSVVERVCQVSGYTSRIIERCNNGCVNGSCTLQCDSINVELVGDQRLFDVKPLLTQEDLPRVLSNGLLLGSTYNQELLFTENSGRIDFLENDNDVEDNFFYIPTNVGRFAEYHVNFSPPIRSGQLGYSNSAGILVDFVGQEINLLGKKYIITQALDNAEVGSDMGRGISLILKSSDGIFLHLVDDDIEDDEGNFPLLVIQTNGQILRVYGTQIKVKGESLPYDPQNAGAARRSIESIEVVMVAQDNYYVGTGNLLSRVISDQGDDREILFTNNWDIRLNSYNGNVGTLEIGELCPLN